MIFAVVVVYVVENGTAGILKHFFHWNDSHLIIIACLRHDYKYIYKLIYFDSKSIQYTYT